MTSRGAVMSWWGEDCSLQTFLAELLGHKGVKLALCTLMVSLSSRQRIKESIWEVLGSWCLSLPLSQEHPLQTKDVLVLQLKWLGMTD